jgi:hypothetical protein
MKQVTVHESASCRLTVKAQFWTQVLNNHMRCFPSTTLYQLSRQFGMSYTNTRRYYYGMHQRNVTWTPRDGWVKGVYNQVRLNVKVDL